MQHLDINTMIDQFFGDDTIAGTIKTNQEMILENEQLLETNQAMMDRNQAAIARNNIALQENQAYLDSLSKMYN